MVIERLLVLAGCFTVIQSLLKVQNRYSVTIERYCPSDQDHRIQFLNLKSPTECADECDKISKCYGFNFNTFSYKPAGTDREEDLGCSLLIRKFCFKTDLKWHRTKEFYLRTKVLNEILENYIVNHGYCDGFALSWGHNITDLVDCAKECNKTTECGSFFFNGTCELQKKGCDVLQNVSNPTYQAFHKYQGRNRSAWKDTKFFFVNRTCIDLRENGILRIETNRTAGDICVLSNSSDQIMGCYQITGTLKEVANLKNFIEINHTQATNYSFSAANYRLMDRDTEIRQLCINKTRDAHLTQNITTNLPNLRQVFRRTKAMLGCVAAGVPEPVITWKFRKCLESDPLCELDWSFQNCDSQICLNDTIYTIRYIKDGLSVVSTNMTIEAKQTGTFRCCAYNNQTKASCKEIEIIVTDIDNTTAFEFKSLGKVSLNEALDLTCKTQVHDYQRIEIQFQSEDGTTTLANYSKNQEIFNDMNQNPYWKANLDYAVSTFSVTLSFHPLQNTHTGFYTCFVFDNEHRLNFSATIYLHPSKPVNGLIIALGLLTPIMLILIGTVIFLKYREFQRTAQLQQLYDSLQKSSVVSLDSNLPVDQQVDNLPFISAYEVPFENLQLGEILGQGEFGTVLQANLRKRQIGLTENIVVAVKRPKDRRNPEHYKTLISELKLMSHIGRHVNIVCLLGTITKKIPEGELFVILEYCELGSLKDFLVRASKNHQSDQELNQDSVNVLSPPPKPTVFDSKRDFVTTSDLIGFAYQIGSGMSYLANTNLIHRDLAARNILLTSDLTAKISDFGLAKEFYTYQLSRKAALPVRWLSIEAWAKGIFSTKSDVWAFGVVMWEIFSLGDSPYAEVPFDQLLSKIKRGHRLKQPNCAPNNVYSLMSGCWAEEPSDRPGFVELRNQLSEILRTWNRSRFEEMLSRLEYCESQMQKEIKSLRDSRKRSLAHLKMSPKAETFRKILNYYTERKP